MSPKRRTTTVFGLSKTHTSGTPPNASKAAIKERTSDSTFWSGTTRTSIQREYFRRDAKKWSFSVAPDAYRTTTSPKSCWLNSPASPSKRTIGAAVVGARIDATRS